jgi:hypothetical protein
MLVTTRKVAIGVPYKRINLLEYGQNTSRRIAMAVVISPLFLLSKARKHFLTVGYTDDEGNQQAMVFRVEKGNIRSVLASLEARTGLRVQFQDEEARKAGKGGRGKAMLVPILALLFAADSAPPDKDLRAQLTSIKRIHVDKLGGGEVANHIRDMIISSLQRTGRYVITENPDRADAFLRGSAEDMVFTDTFQSSDGINARTSLSVNTGGYSSSNRRRLSTSAGVGDNESVRIQERKHESAAAVRLVNKDGDVLWSTIKESMGAKFRGASADVAAKITDQLLEDVDKLKRSPPPQPVQ